MRVLSYNVRSLRDDRDAVAAVVRQCRPDVVCVQEAPRFLRWRSKRAALARLSGMVVLAGERPAGLMVMCGLRVTPLRTGYVLLSKRPRLHQRAVCLAAVEIAGQRFTVASVHCSLDQDERRVHAAEILAAVRDWPDPLILAGDINESADGPLWRALVDSGLQDAGAAANVPTSTARAPRRRIDGIFVHPRLEVVSCEVPTPAEVTRASDHLPVLAEVRPVVAV